MFRRLFSIIKKLCNTGDIREEDRKWSGVMEKLDLGQIPAERVERHHQNDQSAYAASLWPAWVMTAWVLFGVLLFLSALFFLFKSPYKVLTAGAWVI